jgi:DNA polymerase (family 10)
MPRLTASEIAQLLRKIGDRVALKGGNPYRARAYHRAAENLVLSTIPLDQLIREERLTDIPGVGDALAEVITTLHKTGQHPILESVRSEIPQGVLDMLRIPGLKPDRIKKLYEELGLTSLTELEEAAKSNRLASTKGFGPAFQAKVLQGIDMSRRSPGRHLHRTRAAISAAMAELARTHPHLSLVTPAGEFRRGCELISTMALVAINPQLTGQNDTLTVGDSLTIHVTTPQRYGITLLLATGSDQHIEALQAVAQHQGLRLDGEGLRKGKRILASNSEEDIYHALGLPFIAPELRETGKEVLLALDGALPELITDADIRGILHAHTTESDGVDTLQAMVQATKDRGYAYLGLTEHSQTAHYAGGLKPAEVVAQQQHIDRLNQGFDSRFRIFKGIESDILPDGSLDYPDKMLDRFDMVIASIHSQFRLGKAEQTARILKAIANPHTTILGHVTGRQLLRRPGYEVDMEQILNACALHGVAIEINANPWRLDLDWRWCERGLELGCLFSINPDAHSTDEIDNIGWGVLMARKGAVPKDRVLNSLGLQQFAAYLEQRKHETHKRRPTRRRKTG